MHEYLIGKSGTGKSTFLKSHILANEGGFCLLDPHGDLAEAIADAGHCDIYWEPYDTEHVIGFNPLADIPKGQRHLVASEVVASFKAIWGESWGPRLEWILLNAVRLLLDNNGALTDIPALLTDKDYRTRLLRRASFTDFWLGEFAQWDDRYRNEAIAPVLNKVGQLAADPALSQLLAFNTLRIAKVMDGGQRLVVNLAKGKLGETPSHLLGALIVSAVAHAAHRRAVIRETDRVPFTLYADEFQNFATDSFASILSEARKYKLRLVLAHQFTAQVPEILLKAVMGNVGRVTAFRLSAEDSPLLARELGLENANMLVDLPNFEYWARQGLQTWTDKVTVSFVAGHKLAAVKRRTRARYTRA